MFLIRQVTVDDAPTLLKLAKMVHFINLPADPDIIRTKIVRSRRSFAGKTEEDLEHIAFYCGHDPYHLRFLPPVGVMEPQQFGDVFKIVESSFAKAASA